MKTLNNLKRKYLNTFNKLSSLEHDKINQNKQASLLWWKKKTKPEVEEYWIDKKFSQ